ncbi:MAG: toprim domain-containing protein, partial [Eggerthellaceae bacterium]|nr:toprim domain-containing protein [Eggerthellaceae bacterium]
LQETAGRGPSQGEKARLKDVCATTLSFYHTQLMRGRGAEHDAARSYLSGRGMGGEVPKRWHLGFAPGRGALVAHLKQKGFTAKEMVDANVAVERSGRVSDRFYNRVMFPILDEMGDCIAFGGRVVGEGEPKYLNSQETALFHKSRVLYGMDKAKSAITASGVAIVVEGYTDVIACHESGVENVVATLGTALTQHHIRSISRHASKRIVYLFDGDAAGQRAADRALQFIGDYVTPEAGKHRIDLVACTLPDNLDPADYLAAEGADALRAQVDAASPLIAFGIDRRISSFDTDTAEGRASAADSALSVLAPIKDSLLAKDYAVQIASRLHLRENDVLDRLSHLQPPRVRYEDGASWPNSGQASAPRTATPSLAETEISRRRFEANLLGVCVAEPLLALQYADALASLNWHEALHGQIAERLLLLLSHNPHMKPSELVAQIAGDYPLAARLFATASAQGQSPEAYASYAVEELTIKDLEDAVEAYRSRRAEGAQMNTEEQDLLFQTV